MFQNWYNPLIWLWFITETNLMSLTCNTSCWKWIHWTKNQIYVFLWIELPCPENPTNTYARHTETLDSCFDLIRSHQHCIPWSPPRKIEEATTDCRAETLQLSQQFLLHTSDAKLKKKKKYTSIFFSLWYLFPGHAIFFGVSCLSNKSLPC